MVESASSGSRAGLVHGLLERHRDHRALHYSRHLGPGAVGHLSAATGLVVVLHGAAPGAPLHELHQPEVGERAHVVADVSERRAELRGQVTRARNAIFESAQDLYAQWMRERLDEARIPDVADRSHVPCSRAPGTSGAATCWTLPIPPAVCGHSHQRGGIATPFGGYARPLQRLTREEEGGCEGVRA